MTLKDYADLVLAFVNKVDTMWNHFFAANAGIIVWLVSVENEIPLKYRIFATIIYCSYMFVTLIAHLRAYRFLNLSLKEFRLNIDDLNVKTTELKNDIEKLKYNNRYYLVVIAHALAIVFVNYILWTNGYQVL